MSDSLTTLHAHDQRCGATEEPISPAGQRSRRIMDLLTRAGKLTVNELIELIGCSPATVRRDLKRLERDGIVRREHGRVCIPGPLTYEPFLDDPTFQDWVSNMAAEKRRIGQAAAEFVKDGDTIGITPGTTVMQVVQNLRHRRDITVVTNAVNVAVELSNRKHIRVHVTGGDLSSQWFALVGPRAIESAAHHFLDILFVGATGVHWEKGATDHYSEHAAIHQALIRQARRTILVADHTKFGRIARCLVCPVRELNTIVTDAGATDEMVAPYASMGSEIVRV